GEHRAAALAVAMRVHAAAMKLDQRLDERESEPEAALVAREPGIALAERAKELRQQRGVHADAVVADREHGDPLVAVDAKRKLDLSSAELDRVVKQIAEHLTEPRMIAVHGDRRIREIELEIDVRRLECARQILDAVANDLDEVDRR